MVHIANNAYWGAKWILLEFASSGNHSARWQMDMACVKSAIVGTSQWMENVRETAIDDLLTDISNT